MKLIDTIKHNWSVLQLRWRAEKPIFWRSARNICIKIGGSAVAVLGAEKMFDLSTYLPNIVFTICGYIIVACAAMGISAQMTVKDGINNINS